MRRRAPQHTGERKLALAPLFICLSLLGPVLCELGQPGVLFVLPEVLTPVLRPSVSFSRAFPCLVCSHRHFGLLFPVLPTHSSVLAWRIPGTGEPGGLPSVGSHRVRPSQTRLKRPSSSSSRIDWLDLLAVQETLKSLLQHHHSKSSILWHSALFTEKISHPYMNTGKTKASTVQTFVSKVSYLLFNTLSRFVIVCRKGP